MKLDVDKILRHLLWRAEKALEPPMPGKTKVQIDFVVEPILQDDRLKSVLISFPKLRWEAICGESGLLVRAEGDERFFFWVDLPEKIDVPIHVLTSGLYKRRNELLPYPLSRNGPWSRLVCPGWFGVALENALLKGGRRNC